MLKRVRLKKRCKCGSPLRGSAEICDGCWRSWTFAEREKHANLIAGAKDRLRQLEALPSAHSRQDDPEIDATFDIRSSPPRVRLKASVHLFGDPE